MIPAKIRNSFLSLLVTRDGGILEICAGNFLKNQFSSQSNIFNYCAFLENTLFGLKEEQSEVMKGMLVVINQVEYNVNITLDKVESGIKVLIQDQTEIYKYISELNQNRNEFFLMKSELTKKNTELELQKKLAEKANEDKSRFLAVMSHEIRNPLNSILGYADIIASESSDSGINNYAKTLQISSKNLLVIINDILDLSRLEANKLELLEEVFSLKEVLSICVNDFKIRYKDADVAVDLKISEQLPDLILGDSVRITQIISNLINNAFKFTKKGSISLLVDPVDIDDKQNICFKVIDTGRGMRPEKLASIFKEYEQTEVSDYRVSAGAGLGLSIVKRLVDAMNGKVSVASELNVGTTFTVTIPLKVSTKKNLEKTSKKQITDFEFSKIKVLYADDDILNQSIAKHLLEEEGIILTAANDGLEAVEAIQNKAFDVILLDIFMPNLTGEDVIAKKDAFMKFNKKTPAIAITANTSSEDVKRYKDLGFKDVVSKPYKGKDLLDAIEKVLR